MERELQWQRQQQQQEQPARRCSCPGNNIMATLRLVDEYSYEDIVYAYLDCRKRKRNKLTAMQFELNFEENLKQLLDEVNNGTYEIGRSQVFVVTNPKPREVWAADFRDRIVHHLVHRDISEWFEERFIEDTFSCIKNRGTTAAIERMTSFCRKASENWTKPVWYLQIDIANFFVSIRRSILWDIVKEKIGETSLTARLVKQIIFNDMKTTAIIKTPHLRHRVPFKKSLWNCDNDFGLPVGNLSSQFFSNVYLDGMDKFIKHVLKRKWYARYVDDAVILSRDKDELPEIANEINTWLINNRKLHLHPDKIKIKSINSGLNFVGAIIKPYRNYCRNITIGSAKNACNLLYKNPFSADHLFSMNSYLGLLKNTATYNIRKTMCESLYIPTILTYDNKYSKIIKL